MVKNCCPSFFQIGVDSVRFLYYRLATLGSNGKWPDSEIDYTTGCAAQRANWPAENHWVRIRKS